jgi:hypothetical protein
MSDNVRNFGLEYLSDDRFEHAVETAIGELKSAEFRRDTADLLFELDHMLHTFFVAGDEPRWSHDAQRDAVLGAREAMIPLMKRLGLVDEKGAPA